MNKNILFITIALLGWFSQIHSMDIKLAEKYAREVWDVKNETEYEELHTKYWNALKGLNISKHAIPMFPDFKTVLERQEKQIKEK